MKLIQKDFENGYHDNFFMRERRDAQRIRKRMELLLRHQQEGRLLEVGVGQGGLLRRAAAYFHVEGLDLSSGSVAALRPEFGERVHQADITTEALPAAHYDAIAMFNVLEHLPQPGAVIEKCCHALIEGGVMIGSMPNNFGLVGGLVTRITNYFDRTHISTLPPAAWRTLFEQAGFAEVLFFGEITLGRNACFYLRGPLWRWLSFNLMFVARK